MSLEHAILGFLNYEPLTGYELKKIFDTSVAHFWSADQSQIYRTLTRLAEKNWADVTLVEQTDRPDRKVYHITERGRQELRNWLSGPFPQQDMRSAPLVQVFFSAQLSDEENLARFEEAAEFFRLILKRYNQVPEAAVEAMQRVPSPRDHFFWFLTLELGMKTMQTQLDWMESVIQRFRDHQVPQFNDMEITE